MTKPLLINFAGEERDFSGRDMFVLEGTPYEIWFLTIRLSGTEYGEEWPSYHLAEARLLEILTLIREMEG